MILRSRLEPGSTGMAVPCFLLALSFKSIACFRRTFHMKGVFAVMGDKGFWGLSSILENVGHFGLLYKELIGFVPSSLIWWGCEQVLVDRVGVIAGVYLGGC